MSEVALISQFVFKIFIFLEFSELARISKITCHMLSKQSSIPCWDTIYPSPLCPNWLRSLPGHSFIWFFLQVEGHSAQSWELTCTSQWGLRIHDNSLVKFKLVFRKCSVWVSPGILDILTEFSHCFPQSLQVNSRIIHCLEHDHFHPNTNSSIILSFDIIESTLLQHHWRTRKNIHGTYLHSSMLHKGMVLTHRDNFISA